MFGGTTDWNRIERDRQLHDERLWAEHEAFGCDHNWKELLGSHPVVEECTECGIRRERPDLTGDMDDYRERYSD